MTTECTQAAFGFQPLAGREIVAQFSGGTITSDAGGLLLREVEAKTGILARLARCFDDFPPRCRRRDPGRVHEVLEGRGRRRRGEAADGEDGRRVVAAGRDPAPGVQGDGRVAGAAADGPDQGRGGQVRRAAG